MAPRTTSADLASDGITDLSKFRERWSIEYETARSVWSAEQRSADGHTFRYIVERTPASLAAKLANAEAEQ